MNNKPWYYLCDTRAKVALEYTQIPAVWGNVTGMADISEAALADMSWAGHDHTAFLTESAAIIKKIDVKSMQAAKAVGVETARDVLRANRDELLALTDTAVLIDRWTTYSDATKKAISDYRQALRDLPDGDVFAPVWPTIPEELAFLREYV